MEIKKKVLVPKMYMKNVVFNISKVLELYF